MRKKWGGEEKEYNWGEMKKIEKNGYQCWRPVTSKDSNPKQIYISKSRCKCLNFLWMVRSFCSCIFKMLKKKDSRDIFRRYLSTVIWFPSLIQMVAVTIFKPATPMKRSECKEFHRPDILHWVLRRATVIKFV